VLFNSRKSASCAFNCAWLTALSLSLTTQPSQSQSQLPARETSNASGKVTKRQSLNIRQITISLQSDAVNTCHTCSSTAFQHSNVSLVTKKQTNKPTGLPPTLVQTTLVKKKTACSSSSSSSHYQAVKTQHQTNKQPNANAIRTLLPKRLTAAFAKLTLTETSGKRLQMVVVWLPLSFTVCFSIAPTQENDKTHGTWQGTRKKTWKYVANLPSLCFFSCTFDVSAK